jgi:hypothetical protein
MSKQEEKKPNGGQEASEVASVTKKIAIDSTDRQPCKIAGEHKRSAELKWLVDNRGILERYQGEWIGLEGYQLIAHSPNVAEVVTLLKQRGIEIPFIVFIPPAEEGVFMGL